MFRAAIENSTLIESESRKKTREAAHAEMEPVRKIKIVFIASIGWSVERVHRDIEKQLSDAFEFKFYDCFNFVLQEFIDDFHNSDLCMMPLEIQNNKTIWQIIGFLPVSLNFIFLMPLIHNGDS